ncbi:pirin family protein [Rugosimonospora acidiphila]|uniref:Pirin family protein n=1 Tax=Rugosimonospora acidiphila TaxID=556531 RepID=A0ABP9RLS7_9ACTN
MSDSQPVPLRRVDRVHTKTVFGPDTQVDAKAVIIAPDNVGLTDPFLVLSEDWFSSAGFSWHPHRGVETVTLVLDGVLEHGDSLGNAGALEPGDVQWMTAGSGIIHRELAFRDEYAHTLQLWVNLPADRKLVATRYQDLRARAHAEYAGDGVSVAVVSGSSGGVTGPAANHWPILGLLLTLDPATEHLQLLPADHRAFCYVLDGRVTIAGRSVESGQIAWSDPVGEEENATALPLSTPEADERTRVMLFAGRPLNEPVVAGGPFVMNSKAQIQQAFADFHAGKFGDIPRRARLLTR